MGFGIVAFAVVLFKKKPVSHENDDTDDDEEDDDADDDDDLPLTKSHSLHLCQLQQFTSII